MKTRLVTLDFCSDEPMIHGLIVACADVRLTNSVVIIAPVDCYLGALLTVTG